jgi:hypothetical protein
MSDGKWDLFKQNNGVAVAVLLGLLALAGLPNLMTRSAGINRLQKRYRNLHRIHELPVILRNGELDPHEVDALAAGYYEGLERDAGPVGLPAERDDVQFRDDFLRYELKPHLKRPLKDGMRITNSFGMDNPEYPYEKPLGTRRIALLGDSQTLGPYGCDYGALLEDRLNKAYLTKRIDKFEVLNFAVYGYSVLQMMDVALDKAPLFHPDVYLVALTNLELLSKSGWITQVGRLLGSGTDLKYDFLRDVAARAGVRPTDHLPIIRIKLRPYLFPVITQALERIRDRASSQGAQVVVILLATPIDPQYTASDFNSLHKATDGLGVPVIDLRDTFQSVDLNDVQMDPRVDIHPNVKGHRLMFENLLAKLQAQPRAWAAVAGTAAAPAHEPDQSATSKTF